MKGLFGEGFCLETKLKPGILRENVDRTRWREGDGDGSRLRVRAGSPGTLLFCILLFGFFCDQGYSALRGEVPWGWFAGALGSALLFLALGMLCFWLPERSARAGLQRALGGTFVEKE